MPSLTLGIFPSVAGPLNIRPPYHRGRTPDPLPTSSKNYLELPAAQPLPAAFPSLPTVLAWASNGCGDAPSTGPPTPLHLWTVFLKRMRIRAVVK